MRIFAIALLFLSFLCRNGWSQTHTDQNGLKTTVITSLAAPDAQPVRYEIITLGYNSYHWQTGGVVIVELFAGYFSTGYERYIIENGFGQGANSGSPIIKLLESTGVDHNARVQLGTPYNLSTSFQGYVNKALPIYCDVKNYSAYRIRITYLQEKVDVLNNYNQIKINLSPSATSTSGFSVPAILDANLSSTGNLTVTGNGVHSIQNGNVAIGTTDPKGYKLAVAGSMIAESVKVKLQGTWPDYVFAKDYSLPSLAETETHINEKGHLPGIPSAAEVKENGIELGEMNKKLLQKIEELTLHLIEQKKRVDFLVRENEQQKEDIEKLKSK